MTVRGLWIVGRVAMAMILASALASILGCGTPASDFEAFMNMPVPAGVRITKMDGNWGNDPWRCWELSPIDEALKQKLVASWTLVSNPRAFNGVASGGQIYCRFDNLDESYSGDGDSYRAVGIDTAKNVMVVYFYNG
jgi:hypothetical protein